MQNVSGLVKYVKHSISIDFQQEFYFQPSQE